MKTRLEVAREESSVVTLDAAPLVMLPSGVTYKDLRIGGGGKPQKGYLIVLNYRCADPPSTSCRFVSLCNTSGMYAMQPCQSLLLLTQKCEPGWERTALCWRGTHNSGMRMQGLSKWNTI